MLIKKHLHKYFESISKYWSLYALRHFHIFCKKKILNHRYTRLPIPPRVMASSAMGAQSGVFGFSPITHVKANAKQMRSRSLCTRQLFAIVFTLRPHDMHVTYTPDGPRLFWLREKPEDPHTEPHAGIKMAQGLVSLVYVCVLNTKWTGDGPLWNKFLKQKVILHTFSDKESDDVVKHWINLQVLYGDVYWKRNINMLLSYETYYEPYTGICNYIAITIHSGTQDQLLMLTGIS